MLAQSLVLHAAKFQSTSAPEGAEEPTPLRGTRSSRGFQSTSAPEGAEELCS